MRPFAGLTLASLVIVTAACGPRSGGSACGITALAGATMLLEQFSVPRQTIADAPLTGPEIIPVRVAAGPAFRGRVGLGPEGWAVTVEGEMPPGSPAGFGVLVLGPDGIPRGVMVYTGRPVAGAPPIGTVTAGAATVPLLGLRADVAGLEDPVCPFFPDSVARP